jgi:coproporphyrinogen III oxidase-like Fe-S oxidoreductase
VQGRRVHALYFGGATANLAKPDELGAIFLSLKHSLHLDTAEVTLEGVPSLFLSLLGGPLSWLASLPVGSRRVSMGVQSFDATQIARMGREAFGDERTVAKVVAKAHAKGMTASGDFLFNLPHQSLAHMLDDVQRAVRTGLDQICFYNLVLYAGLGTPWSKDASLVAAVPKNDEACENWLALRDALLANGFVQTTLTNFERTPRFAYEIASFTPETYDAFGVGPGAISAFVDVPKRRAIKHVNGKDLGGDEDLWFPLDDEDLRLLFLTRWLSKCTIDRATYVRVFDADVVDEFKDALLACLEAGLLTIDEARVSLTPRGMFYADTVVGILAARRSAIVRARGAGTSTMHMAVAPTRFGEHDHFMG